jgi:hypothetical protein
MRRPAHNQPSRILKRRIERKFENVLREHQFGFRRGKETKDANGMLRITTERTLYTDKETCACFIDWQKAFDPVKWTKLMQILMGTGIDRRKRKMISKFYMDQNKVRLGHGETRSVVTGKGVRQLCCLSRIPFTLTANT